MGKRKQTAPQRATDEKRKCLSWNMLDGQTEGSVSVIPDNDPSLQVEAEKSAEHRPIITESSSSKSDHWLDVFDLYVENSLFNFSVHKQTTLKEDAWRCVLAEFSVKFLTESLLPLPTELPNTDLFTLHVGNETDRCIFSYDCGQKTQTPSKKKSKGKEQANDVRFWLVSLNLPLPCLQALRCRSFQVVLDKFDPDSMMMTMKIIGTESVLARLVCPSEAIRPKGVNQSLLVLMDHFYKIAAPDYEDLPYSRKHDIDEIYATIKHRHTLDVRPILAGVQHEDLLPTLRLYQQAAITWMLFREKHSMIRTDGLHMLYTEVITKDGQTLYYNKHGGVLVRDRPIWTPSSPGGILGDEMGLGKTVEVLGCILHHPRDCIPHPPALPVVKEEEIPVKKKKKRRSKSKDTAEPIIMEESDTDTLIYSDFNRTDLDQSCDQFSDPTRSASMSCDIKDHVTSVDQLDMKSVSLDTGENCDVDKSFDRQNQVNDKLEDTADSSLAVCDMNSDSVEQPSYNIEDTTSETKSVTFAENKEQNLIKEKLNSSEAENMLSDIEELKSESKDEITDQRTYETLDIEELSSVKLGKSEEVIDDTYAGVKSESPLIDENKIINDATMETEENMEDENDTAFTELEKVESDNLTDDVEERHPCKNFFTTLPVCQREEFACICGDMETYMRGRGKKRKHAVQCVTCRLWQHAECVNYDLTDPYRGEFKCPHCHVASRPIVSGATLIISPSSIAHQWVDEILKHVAKTSLNVMLYLGVNKQGFVQPQTLARQDIVITTYETLRKELDYVDLPHSNSDKGRKLRHPKRFMALPSPIIAVEWWRICLDEAQMVECTTTKTAEMALRLTAVNRWCVTGTPIQKGLDDLYGLLLFLGVDPYWVQQWWSKLVYDPFCHGVRAPMYDLLTSVLWRTVKSDVLDQINIPAQSEQLKWLTFSPVEEHFYRKQHRDCVRLSMERLSKWTDSSIKLSSLDRHTVNQLLYPLVRLRQACCHPQAVRGEFVAIQKSTMTMEELLESLTKKARLEAEESHRAYVAAINGEAGLHIIHNEYVEAVEKYREVLRSVEEHKDRLHTDSLQQLHAMYNLHEILTSKPKGVDPTLRDDFLQQQIGELKDKYLAKAVAFVRSTEEALAPVQVDVKRFQRELNDGSEWWMDVIQYCRRIEQDEGLLLKVTDDLKENRDASKGDVLLRSCRDTNGLLYAVENRLSKLHKAYTDVLKALRDLQGVPNQDLINHTVECCLRPADKILATCPFCKSEELIQAYETRLFLTVDKGIEQGVAGAGIQVNTQRQGTWADSDLERALKSILSFAKSYRVAPELVEYGTAHIKLFDAWKKEFKRLRMNWAGIKEHVGAFDELDMCTTRLRLRMTEEPVPETPQPNILEKTELAQHKLKLISDRIVAQGEMRKKLGQLLYLTNLAKAQDDNKNKDNPELCPICQVELGTKWSVMQCGHCYCLECIRILAERAAFGRTNFSIKCAICRQGTHTSEISYVMTKTEQGIEDEDIRVLGSHSTKVEAIVRCLLKIKRDYPSAKSLVFSTWTDVLSVIARALEENDIRYRALYAAGKFQQNLASFKQEEDVSALLLPVHSGANGLNLIEATHVLLVEPILNPAQELQAIGRVHRIGQTKPTHVYRFLVQSTIEQKMQMLLRSLDMKNASSNIEESALTIGDLSSLFSQQLEEENREGVSSMDEADTPGLSGEVDTPGSGGVATPEPSGEVDTPGPSGVLATPEPSGEVDTPGPSGVVDTPELSGVMDTPGLSGKVDTPELSGEVDTPGPSAEEDTPGLSGEVNTLGLYGEVDTPGPSGEVDTPRLSGEVDTPGPSGEVDIPGPSAEEDTPGLSGEVNTLGLYGEVDTPGPSGEVDTPGPSGEVDTPGLSGEVDIPGPSGEVDTPGPSGEVATSGQSTSAIIPGPSGEVVTPGSSDEVDAQACSDKLDIAGPSGCASMPEPSGEVNFAELSNEVNSQGPSNKVNS